MNDTPTLTFLGATGTVTGSKYLLEVNGQRVLVDCGLFQGKRPLREQHKVLDGVDLRDPALAWLSLLHKCELALTPERPPP